SAVVQLRESVDPEPIVVFRHIDGAEYAAPVGNFDIKTRFLKGRNIRGGLKAVCRCHCQNTNAPTFCELLEFGNARQPCLERAVDNTGYRVCTARLGNVIEP